MYAQNLNKTFTVQAREASTQNNSGRVITQTDPVTKTLKGMLSNASEKDIERYKQRQHIITHTIVQKSRQVAEREDTLILDTRKFYVQDVENPGGITKGIGCYTIYQVEERRDIK